MFETVIPETVVPRSRRLFIGTLPLSIAAHLALASGLVAASIWNVPFPVEAPHMFAPYSLAEAPAPPPPPPPPAPRRAAIVPDVKPVTMKMPLVAPSIIPDAIPLVEDVRVDDVPVEAVASTADGPRGIDGGVVGGEIGGAVGGVIGGLVAAPPPEVIEVKRDDPLPVGAISQEFPPFPEYALSRNWQDVLVVRYVIGKNGRVTSVEVIEPPERKLFAEAAIKAIRYWRFHPYRDANGEPKEVVHELTVQFKIARTRGR